MSRDSADAVVIGAGHNGLVAAAMLADAGWDVQVLEAQPQPGGAVKSAELFPGYISDLYSAFYPLSVASPALTALQLEDHGLRWTHAPAVVGHPRSPGDEDAAVIYRDIDRTAAELDHHHSGDGDRWIALFEQWQRVKGGLTSSLFAPFPPVRGLVQLLRALGTADALKLAHLLLLPAGVMAEQLFDSEPARLLLLGNAMHADVPIDAPGSGVMGYLLIMMAQDGGWPVPVGGAGQLTAALVNRASSAGARIECGRDVDGIEVRGGRAVAVRTTDGQRVRVRRAVIADTSAPRLFRDLLPADAVPDAMVRDMSRFVWDTPVLKVNYALDAPIPWRSKNLNDVGTVHVGADHDGLIRWMADLNTATLPDKPFMLFGQMTTADPSRSPAGTESAWAYTHLPRGVSDDASADRLAERVDEVLEEYAPGFGQHIAGRTIQRPSDLEAGDANLHTGAVNGGTSQLFQQLIFRPAPGFGRAETPVDNVYLGSAGATPGGGVHGVCGRNAAKAALAGAGVLGWPRRRLNRTVLSLMTR
ncbi:NAD(P)/FAD-dependent oxidoreductase [Mycolicibacterium wolinskyi]|uniref:Pyridine nucleotide-disulfide oxidoreductase domain-containing protein 2 n=1 Tax=Mycolicibacterium wolinskyi TaxID=59750 RepID=A0A1X2FDI3_9MYCO|nr:MULTISPECIES: NAD(P)/FAD-dependent oxidoreductase [Mycolicibacterium]MCV7289186.1 NAD(P)/FAD-dependent oxidoreductase [Mycolicibacterium wolinskyi]MCV7294213.1 NAD(P)/FAD-dependent oxidoreductase [Mycolicibacterium goodii]ORX16496.1 FAD-dependent oxidoreductase [Mycolicibacterium wolinskyi]